MKPSISKQRNQALTRLEVLVVVFMTILLFAILFALVLPIREAERRRAERLNCINNLREINMALRTWEADGWRETNSTVESIPSGLNSGQKAWIDVMGMSNVLRSAKILRCPADREDAPTNSPGFHVRISYFLNLDASETYPQMILSGDDNLVIGDRKHPRPVDGAAEGDIPVKSGILEITTNTEIAWTGKRHGFVASIGFADGSVAEESFSGLNNAAQCNVGDTPTTTNHWAIP